jgi:nucleoside-diphosphate-sugar epimerase
MPAPEGSVKRRCGTIDKFHSLTDFEAKIALPEGIRLTLESLK